jgi:cysteine desulfurase
LVDNVHGIVDVDGEALVTLLQEDDIFASTGSTCSQYAQKESHVLKSLGITSEQARGAILFTGSIYTEQADLRRFSEAFEEALNSLRALKPW